METKLSMKTIYLLLVISIGLIGLAVGSTFAVFTASAEINNPISFSSNLEYTSDVFDAVDIKIPASEAKVVKFAVWNSNYIDDANYAAWYIYDGNTSDVSFSIDTANEYSNIPTGVLPTEDPPGAGVYITVVNNTSKSITLTMGVSTSNEDIVLPSYMHLIPNNPGYTLNITKGTGVSEIYYTVDGATTYAKSTSSISITARSEYSYYGVPSSGYTMTYCTKEHPCSDTVDSTLYGDYENKTLSATSSGSTAYNLTLTKGTGIATIYYKVNGASTYTSTTSTKTISVNSGTTYYYYGVASTGYTYSSCTAASPCSGTMTSAVSKTLTATVNSYNLTLTKGTGISTINYKVNGASAYVSTTSSKTISVNYGTTYYYYVTTTSGYTYTCTSASNPCSGTMGTSDVSKTLTATASSYNLTLTKGTGIATIYYKVNGASTYTSTTSTKTISVNAGTTYYYYGVASTGYTYSTCTSTSPCSGTMTSAVSKTLTATVKSYNLTLTKGTGISTIYYKVNGASSYTSTTATKTISVNYGTTYYYYVTPSSGYTYTCTSSSSPCSGTMGASAVSKTLTATSSSTSSYTVTIMRKLGTNTATQLASKTISSGSSYSYTFTTPVTVSSITYNYNSVSCTNGQTASVTTVINSGDVVTQATTTSKKLTISSVTASTVCTLNFTVGSSGTVIS